MPYPPPFNQMQRRTSTEHTSAYNLATTKHATLHAGSLSAILAYRELETGTGEGAVGKIGDTITAAEYHSHSGGIHAVFYDKSTGEFQAAVYKDGKTEPYRPSELNSVTALLFAMIPAALRDGEFSDAYEDMKQALSSTPPDKDKLCASAFVLCDNLYRRITGSGEDGTGLKTRLESESQILPISDADMAATEILTGTSLGKFLVLAKPVNPVDFAGAYSFGRQWSEEEQQRLCTLPDYYKIPKEIVEICQCIQATTGSSHPMRNFLLRGPAGTGKTEGAMAVSVGTNQPYLFIDCAADSDSLSFLGSYMPVSEPEQPDSLPAFEDILLNPPEAYRQLTGKQDNQADAGTVFRLMVEQQAAVSGVARYRYVDTPLVEAVRNGYCIEIMEPTMISQPGVLVGLNSLLDGCGSIRLPTGEILKRHPDTVIILTTNVDYEGCRPLNQSILSRMDLVVDFPPLSVGEMAQRVLARTGCTERETVSQMAQVVADMNKRCQKHGITDGCCGYRELLNWVQIYMICKNVHQAARHTVLSGATSDPEMQADLFSTCLKTRFAV